ncbi:TRIC cation channel family protein [Cellulomonas sp.]|uniref:trimeric intracellular cation channel family protein n=1 Tax=Cellulomonas sp. TaxID=40001 RepID=UPI00338F44CB
MVRSRGSTSEWGSRRRSFSVRSPPSARGTLRDVLIREIPTVLSSGLYAIPALAGALVVVGADELGVAEVPAAITGALTCFVIRMPGVHFDIDAPGPPGSPRTVDA